MLSLLGSQLIRSMNAILRHRKDDRITLAVGLLLVLYVILPSIIDTCSEGTSNLIKM